MTFTDKIHVEIARLEQLLESGRVPDYRKQEIEDEIAALRFRLEEGEQFILQERC